MAPFQLYSALWFGLQAKCINVWSGKQDLKIWRNTAKTNCTKTFLKTGKTKKQPHAQFVHFSLHFWLFKHLHARPCMLFTLGVNLCSGRFRRRRLQKTSRNSGRLLQVSNAAILRPVTSLVTLWTAEHFWRGATPEGLLATVRDPIFLRIHLGRVGHHLRQLVLLAVSVITQRTDEWRHPVSGCRRCWGWGHHDGRSTLLLPHLLLAARQRMTRHNQRWVFRN